MIGQGNIVSYELGDEPINFQGEARDGLFLPMEPPELAVEKANRRPVAGAAGESF